MLNLRTDFLLILLLWVGVLSLSHWIFMSDGHWDLYISSRRYTWLLRSFVRTSPSIQYTFGLHVFLKPWRGRTLCLPWDINSIYLNFPTLWPVRVPKSQSLICDKFGGSQTCLANAVHSFLMCRLPTPPKSLQAFLRLNVRHILIGGLLFFSPVTGKGSVYQLTTHSFLGFSSLLISFPHLHHSEWLCKTKFSLCYTQ